MPSPENLAFFSKHENILVPLISRENSSRIKAGFDPLPEDVVDDFISQMRTELQTPEKISQFKFPPPEETDRKRPPKQIESPVPERSSAKFVFEVSECQNGFVLYERNQRQSYVFRTQKELMGIFKKIFFEKQHEEATN